MDVEKLLTKAESLNDYMKVTKDVSRKYKNSKIPLTMTTVLALKKVRYLEIEHFNKCEAQGAASLIIERVLEVAPSKTWGLLGKELVSLLQYWLNFTRKHLIIQNTNWWTFMSLLLKFIKELRLKDPSLPDVLVECTAEHLLDIATRAEPDVLQRLDIVYCLNLCCADSSREVRFATRHHLENYLVKLSALLATSGHAPAQYLMLETLLRWLLPRHSTAVRQAAAAKWFPDTGSVWSINVKLSALLATSGHAPAQYLMLETLLRWLLPRQSTAVRQAAAAKWFPDTLYKKDAVDIFLERTWQNFYQDARDFLNAHNQAQGLVTSVVYHQMTIGTLIMECSSRRDSWLDINPGSKSITVLLEPRMMETLSVSAATLQTLVIHHRAVLGVQLCREASDLNIVIKTTGPIHLHPSEAPVGGGDIAVVVSARNDLRRLDRALADVFGDKYEVLIDFDALTPASPRDRNKKIFSSSEEDTRFSHPVKPTRRKASGYAIKSRSAWKSPSTTSTTSLALLHDRLEALPKFKYNKEPLKVSALPDLSIVSELTEINDSQSVASSTGRFRTYGLGYKSFRQCEKQSQSDGEKYKSSKKYISPVVAVNEPSCLLVATVGTDESVINDTIESISKSKDYTTDNIVDLLLQEALKNKDEKLDSGINTGENKKSQDLRDSDAIENTPNFEQNKAKNKKQVVGIDKSDDCNEIEETQFDYVSVRKKVVNKHRKIEDDIEQDVESNEVVHIFDQEAVEKFFSQHIAEDKTGGLLVSPTLARKINETSSEASDRFEDCIADEDFLNVQDIQDVEIIDCLNDIIDKVCQEFKKCAEILEEDNTGMDILKMAEMQDSVPTRVLANIENVDSENKKDMETPKKRARPKKVIKLKIFKTKKSLSKTRLQKQNKSDLPPKMSTIPENKDSIESQITEKTDNQQITNEIENDPEITKEDESLGAETTKAIIKVNEVVVPEINDASPRSSDLNTPLIRRRRKLYSPKDDHHNDDDDDHKDVQNETTKNKEVEVQVLQHNDSLDFKSGSKKTPKYAATCYKDIEKERKKNIRLPKARRSKGKAQARSPSPRTKKMNELFDNLKTNVEEHDVVILADKKFIENELAVYNFTTDSEDEDFKKKKVEIKKRMSTTTNASCESTVSRHGRIINKVNYSEKSSDDKSKKPKSKNVVRRKRAQRRPHNLADEKMRDAQHEDLNTSVVLENKNEVVTNPEFILEIQHEMEVIGSELDEPTKAAPRSKRTVKKKKKITTATVKKETTKYNDDNDDRTLSPLPGLVIENVSKPKEDANDSVSTQIMNKLKKMYHEDPSAVDESNTTQNLLLDIDKGDFSHHFNISSELNNTRGDVIVRDTKARRNNTVLNDTEHLIEVINFEENTKELSNIRDNKVLNISISDVQSEKSIATVGKSPITAHGDIDEEPPNNSELNKRVHSRNLEIDEMDTSIKDYYFKLREEIKPRKSNSSDSSKQSTYFNKKSVKNPSPKCISPIVHVHKKSHDDISKWWTTTDTTVNKKTTSKDNISNDGSEKSMSPVVSLRKMSYNDISKWIPTKSGSNKPTIDLVANSSDNGSEVCVSPVVSLTKLSHDDISRWLPSRRNSYDSSAESSEKSIVIEKSKEKGLSSDKSVFLRPKSSATVQHSQPQELGSNPSKNSKKTEEINISCESLMVNDRKPNSTKYSKVYKAATKSTSSIKKIDIDLGDGNNKDLNSITTHRKSAISPIKLFDDLEHKELVSLATESKNDDLASLATEKDKSKREHIFTSPILNITQDKTYNLRKRSSISSTDSKISSSTRVDGKSSIRGTFKRKSSSPVKVYGKKRIVEVMTDSGPSVSSIDDWFKKSAPVSAAESLSASYGDSLQNIMEKLDTTLTEIHQSTSNNFIHMFVVAKNALTEAKNERRRAVERVASDVKKEVVSIIGAKFADFEKRAQESDTQFMENLKNSAAEFIREDCKKKRVMVALLQEDIKAVANTLRKGDCQ